MADKCPSGLRFGGAAGCGVAPDVGGEYQRPGRVEAAASRTIDVRPTSPALTCRPWTARAARARAL